MRNPIISLTLVSLLASVLFVAAACTDSEPPATLDITSLSADEVIANVETVMRNTQTSSSINPTCFGLVGFFSGWENATAFYNGSGKWRITVSDFEWEYFERTDSVRSVGGDFQRRFGC